MNALATAVISLEPLPAERERAERAIDVSQKFLGALAPQRYSGGVEVLHVVAALALLVHMRTPRATKRLNGIHLVLQHLRLIAVVDNGAGVPPEERQLVFERFARRGGAGRRTGSEGAGLGLSLVDEHVKMHGGRVWVEDRLDGQSGARFVIELMATELDD